MSVVGIDFGSQSCFITAYGIGGMKTLYNNVGLGATPSFVAFGMRQRHIGIAAKDQALTNLENTVSNFKKYLGWEFDNQCIQLNEAPFSIVRTESGGVGMKVNYLYKEQIFSAEQITAMLFTKLKEIAEKATKTVIEHYVVSVPSYFSDAGKKAILDAARIARLPVLTVMDDTEAAALSYYGLRELRLPSLKNEKPINVVFVDCGYSSLQVCVCTFRKGELKVLASSSDSTLGGRKFDAILAGHFFAEFLEKHNLDRETTPTSLAGMKLLFEVEKLKKVMSSNPNKLPFKIESFMFEKDLDSTMCRVEFEKICDPLLQRIEIVLKRCFYDAKVELEEIHSVEVVGGSTRIPAIKILIERVWHKLPSGTLNQDDSVSRGCAIQAAMLSSMELRVSQVRIQNVQPHPVKLMWDAEVGVYTSDEVSKQCQGFTGLSFRDIADNIMSEKEMILRDKNEMERLECKNTLESFACGLKEVLDSELKQFVNNREIQQLTESLAHLKIWISGQGCDEEKDIYLRILESLKAKGKSFTAMRMDAEVEPPPKRNKSEG